MQTKSFNKKVLSKLVASSLLFASASWASAMEIQGFFSAGGGVTFDTPKLPRNENMIADQSGRNHYLNTVSEYHKTVSPSLRSLSSRFNAHTKNRIGMQFYKRLSDDISFTTQLLATGEDSNFDFNAKWGFLSWQAQPNFTVRAGRLVIPLFMLSEYIEVGYAYPWVSPPMEMYSGVPLDSWSGMDFSWTGYRGDWDYRVTTALGTVDQQIWVGGITDDFKQRNGVSFNVDFGNDYLRMRVGASRVDMASSLGLDTVDGVVSGIGTLYAGWAVNKFDSTGDGIIDAPNFASWRTILGDITSDSVETALGGAAALDTALTGSNLAFLQAATAAGLASNISGAAPYNETVNAGGALGKAYSVYATYSGVQNALAADHADGTPIADQAGVVTSVNNLLTANSLPALADTSTITSAVNVDAAIIAANKLLEGVGGVTLANVTDGAVSAGSINIADIEAIELQINGVLAAQGMTPDSASVTGTAKAILGTAAA